MRTIIPLIPRPRTPLDDELDMRPLAYAVERMTPDLWAALLPGETPEEARARREAAADILDELLHEAPAEIAEAVIW
ncbi:hypothetical protein GCM10010466_65460 [Planomonospora alba]|uniref:Uncharacterized protein n=1 Tax=Planomonospora alba TaxID=161354 RepID=A0ABP6P2Z1_9ACTN